MIQQVHTWHWKFQIAWIPDCIPWIPTACHAITKLCGSFWSWQFCCTASCIILWFWYYSVTQWLGVPILHSYMHLNKISSSGISFIIINLLLILLTECCYCLTYLLFRGSDLIKATCRFSWGQCSFTESNISYYLNMAESSTSSPSSLVYPLDNLDATVAELTHDLIPDFLTQVAACDASDVDWTMAEPYAKLWLKS